MCKYNKENCYSWTVVHFHICWLDFSLNILSENHLRHKPPHILNTLLSPDWLLSHMVVVFSFCLSLESILFWLLSPHAGSRGSNSPPSYNWLSEHLLGTASLSLSLPLFFPIPHFLSPLLMFPHALKKPLFDLLLSFTLVSFLSALAFAYLFVHPSHLRQCLSAIFHISLGLSCHTFSNAGLLTFPLVVDWAAYYF